MFIRAYLRASTEDQFADRAKEMLEQFVQERGHKIASYYRKNISGTKLERPELGRLLMDSHPNDIVLVEQIDRLTRLSNSDWITLKKQIEQHELRIVSLDVPTSWKALSDKDPSQADPVTRAVITVIYNCTSPQASAIREHSNPWGLSTVAGLIQLYCNAHLVSVMQRFRTYHLAKALLHIRTDDHGECLRAFPTG